MNISSYLQMVIKGIILLLAICIDLYTNKAKFRFKLNKKEKFFIVLVLGVITIFSIVIKYYSMHL